MYAEGNAFDRNFLIAMFLVATVIVLRRNVAWAGLVQANKLFLLFFLYCGLSVVWSEFPIVALKRFVRFAGVLPMALLIITDRSPVEAVMSVFRRCSYLLVMLSFIFIRYFPQLGRYYNPFTWEAGFCGVCGNKNELAAICLVGSLVFLWDLLQHQARDRGLFRSGDALMTIAMSFVSGYILYTARSATAIFCIVLGAAILLATSLNTVKQHPRRIAYRFLGAGILAAMAELGFNISNAIIRILGRDPSLTNRSMVWRVFLGTGTNPIVGTGFGSFWTTARMEYFASLEIGATQAHNGYLETYLNLGIIGVLFFLALLIRSFRTLAEGLADRFAFNQFRLAYLAVFAFYNWTEAVFTVMGLMASAFFILNMNNPKTPLAQD